MDFSNIGVWGTLFSVATTVVVFMTRLLDLISVSSLVRRRNRDMEVHERLGSILAFDIKRRNRLLVQHAFEMVFRKGAPYAAWCRLLDARSPLSAIRLYFKVREFVVFSYDDNEFAYRKSYSTIKRRIAYLVLFLVVYFIFMFVGSFAAIELAMNSSGRDFSVVIAQALFSVIFIFSAGVALTGFFNLMSTDDFFREVAAPSGHVCTN